MDVCAHVYFKPGSANEEPPSPMVQVQKEMRVTSTMVSLCCEKRREGEAID